MVAHKLPPISKPEDVTSVDAYEYLLKMRMDRVKATAVEEQLKLVETARAAIALLEETTAEAMWTKDLDEFLKTWKHVLTKRQEALADVDGKKRSTASKKKFAVKR